MDDATRLRELTEAHLSELVEAIWHGRCVAFVGAGFSAAARLPDWRSLIRTVAAHVDESDEVRQAVDGLMRQREPSSRELEAAAQLLQDQLGRERFHQAVTQALTAPHGLTEAFRARKRDLLTTPFRAVLTTNFDPLLPGEPPGPKVYRELLRQGWSGPWDPRYWPTAGGREAPRGPRIVQLHGAVKTDRLVFARRDYQELLFADSAYLTFLKALFATRTVLFMGFSFRDAYLDLLRAELMHLVGQDSEAVKPMAYAILTDVSWAEALYLRRHEGMGVLWYPKTPDHAGFDELLDRIARATNPLKRLGARLAGARVLWLDPEPGNNQLAFELLGRGAVTEVKELEQAQRMLRLGTWDLVLTHWGWRPDGPAVAQRLLDWMHDNAVHVPVVGFGSYEYGPVNRPMALRWGAADLTWTWPDFFQAVDRVLPRRS